MGGLRGNRERGKDKRDDELFHGGLILVQRERKPGSTFASNVGLPLEAIKESSQEFCCFLGLFPGGVVGGFRDDFQLAVGDVLAHQFGFVHARQVVFVAGNEERWNIDGL